MTTTVGCSIGVYASITPAAHDFDSTGTSDIAWRQNGTGAVALWMMNNGTVAQTATLGTFPPTGQSWVNAISMATARTICCDATQRAGRSRSGFSTGQRSRQLLR
jgi:hypothetical protein